MIEIKDLCKSYGDKEILKNINLTINDNEIVAIIGKSGCGKSTLLRCISRLENITKGSIYIDNENINNIKDYYKKVGMVFQNFNLFENLNVLDNLILSPVKLKLMTKDEAVKKAKNYLKDIGLINKINEYPKNLSGGEKQRVAIIRALMENPKIILFDEPTSSLDPQMTQEVLELMKKLSNLNITIIIVSHEINFIKEFAQRIIFIDNKKVISDASVVDTFNSDDENLKEFLKDIK
ncbi:MAG: amino acid ABC transporter ATP-binding protein [Bacilli bacterium]